MHSSSGAQLLGSTHPLCPSFSLLPWGCAWLWEPWESPFLIHPRGPADCLGTAGSRPGSSQAQPATTLQCWWQVQRQAHKRGGGWEVELELLASHAPAQHAESSHASVQTSSPCTLYFAPPQAHKIAILLCLRATRDGIIARGGLQLLWGMPHLFPSPGWHGFLCTARAPPCLPENL